MPAQPAPRPGKLVKPTNITKKPAVPRLAQKAPKKSNVTASATNPAQQIALERKIAQGNAEKEKLQKTIEKLNADLMKLHADHAIWEQEQDRVNSTSILTRNQLAEQKLATLMLEKTAAEQRSHQAQQQTRLMQKIRSLMLSTKAKRVAATQTEGGADIRASAEADTQTMEELTKEKAKQLLRDSDSLLTAFISELEREKVNAQNDLKFSIVQMEQRMKEENSVQLRRVQEASEKQLEMMSQQHGEQMRTIQHSSEIERQRMEGRIEQLQREVESLRDSNDSLSRNLDEAQEKLKDQAIFLGKAETQAELNRNELSKLRDYKKHVQHDARYVEEMKKELTKYKDINEIILSEFAKLEEERDGLIQQIEKGINRIGTISNVRNNEFRTRIHQLRELAKMGT